MPISQSLQQPYFKEAMSKVTSQNVNMIIVTAHIDPQTPPEMSQIYKAIRSYYPNIPLIFLVGHAHEQYFEQLDVNCYVLESGKYFEVVGKLEFDLDDDNQIQNFSYEWVPTSLKVRQKKKILQNIQNF